MKCSVLSRCLIQRFVYVPMNAVYAVPSSAFLCSFIVAILSIPPDGLISHTVLGLYVCSSHHILLILPVTFNLCLQLLNCTRYCFCLVCTFLESNAFSSYLASLTPLVAWCFTNLVLLFIFANLFDSFKFHFIFFFKH